MKTYDKAKWEAEFLVEYIRRVGLAPHEAGVDSDDMARYRTGGYSPSDAVSGEIERYGLDDLDDKYVH